MRLIYMYPTVNCWCSHHKRALYSTNYYENPITNLLSSLPRLPQSCKWFTPSFLIQVILPTSPPVQVSTSSVSTFWIKRQRHYSGWGRTWKCLSNWQKVQFVFLISGVWVKSGASVHKSGNDLKKCNSDAWVIKSAGAWITKSLAWVYRKLGAWDEKRKSNFCCSQGKYCVPSQPL